MNDTQDIGTVAWDSYNKEGLQTGECKIHVANWTTGKTLCGIDLFPTHGARAGWGRHNYYESESDVGTSCCNRCSKAEAKLQESIVDAPTEKIEYVKGGRYLTPIVSRGEVTWYEDIMPNKNFNRIYYIGDRDWTEVTQAEYDAFRSELNL